MDDHLMPRFLVVVRAGRKSLHPGWIAPAGRQNFTLLVAAYEPLGDLPCHPNLLYREIPGAKLHGLAELFAREPDLLQDYSHIALLDDDIMTNAADLERCFLAGVEHGLEIWQPSLTWSSYFSYAVFLRNPATYLRYCNFIELMCPFFTAAALTRALPLIGLGHETGIDRFWCRLSDQPAYKYAVIDAVAVTHTRPIGATATQQGFQNGYDEVLNKMDRSYGIVFRGPVVYGGILKGGRTGGIKFTSRLLASITSLLAIGAVARTPARKSFCAMRVLDHIRHNLTRPINNDRIRIPQLRDLINGR